MILCGILAFCISSQNARNPGSSTFSIYSSEIADIFGFTWEMTSVPGVSRSTDYCKAQSLPQQCLIWCTQTTCQSLHATSSCFYADDICCAVQGKAFAEIECTLSADIGLTRMAEYCRRWRLKPSATKTFYWLLSPSQRLCFPRAGSLNGRAATQTGLLPSVSPCHFRPHLVIQTAPAEGSSQNENQKQPSVQIGRI